MGSPTDSVDRYILYHIVEVENYETNHTPFSLKTSHNVENISTIDFKFHNTFVLSFSQGFQICFECFAKDLFHLIPHSFSIFLWI